MSKTIIRSIAHGTEPLGEHRAIQVHPDGRLPVEIDNQLLYMYDAPVSQLLGNVAVQSHDPANPTYTSLFANNPRQQCFAIIIDTTGAIGINFVRWRFRLAAGENTDIDYLNMVGPYFGNDSVFHRVALFAGQTPTAWFGGGAPAHVPAYETLYSSHMQIGFAKTGDGANPTVQIRRFYLERRIHS